LIARVWHGWARGSKLLRRDKATHYDIVSIRDPF
jgi:hypothetical protein